MLWKQIKIQIQLHINDVLVHLNETVRHTSATI